MVKQTLKQQEKMRVGGGISEVRFATGEKEHKPILIKCTPEMLCVLGWFGNLSLLCLIGLFCGNMRLYL